MAEPFIGEIRLMAFNYAPQNWAYCAGQTMLVAQYQALAAVIGFQYGGDGRQTFKLPDMRGQTPIGAGEGQGLTPRKLGPVSGSETVSLSYSQVAGHQHQVTIYASPRPSNAPSGTVGLSGTVNQFDFSKTNIDPWTTTTGFASSAVLPALGNASGFANPHENRQPYLALSFCIALSGDFPVRP